MESLVRVVLKRYNGFVAEAVLAKKEKTFKNEEQIKRIHLAVLRTEMVQNWLQLLTYDERFVIQKHLIEDLEWARVVHSFIKHWDELFIRSERQLGTYQASALKKIVGYCSTYPETIFELFGDIVQIDQTATLQPLISLKNAKE